MKIRNGFVSNSSSSSFVGIGWEFKKDSDFLEMVKKYMSEEEYNDILEERDTLHTYVPNMFAYWVGKEFNVFCLYSPLNGNIDEVINSLNYFKNDMIPKYTILQKIKETLGEPIIVSGEIY